ncbi:Vacuolar (H+)-ATPase G subunit [Dillenia turbinata]|uniref:V-type proton ATPase subunit G n=1 Tax=Dillenia turbinata TaxID=194707 RepID=A0AAN8ULN2_9MAGN
MEVNQNMGMEDPGRFGSKSGKRIYRRLWSADLGLFGKLEIPCQMRLLGGYTVAMDSMKAAGGIQMLLTAEKDAQQVISNARNFKMTRLRQAKEEADREVAQYRSNLESEYQNKISKASGSSGLTVKRLDEETEEKINSLKQKSSRVSKDVVAMLIKHVTTVRT